MRRHSALAAPMTGGRGPDGADDRTPDEERGKEKKIVAVDGRSLIIR